MRHKMLSIFALTLVMALAGATALLAQDTTTATGKVTNVDTSAGTITVTTTGGSSESFATDAQSMYMSNGRTITLQTMKVGDQVTVTYRNVNGNKTATHVDVVSAARPSTTTGDTYGSTIPPDRTTDDSNRNDMNPGDTYRDTDTRNRMDTNTPADDSLPRTASPLPLIGLAAAVFGGAALALAGFRRFAS